VKGAASMGNQRKWQTQQQCFGYFWITFVVQ